MRLAAILPGLLAAALASGCAQPPADRVQAARERLAGLADEAETYAPGAWSKAEQAVEQLDAELEAQEGRFFRSYSRTEELIPSVETAAEDVKFRP